MERLKQTLFNPTWQDPNLFPDIAEWILPVYTCSTDDSTYSANFVSLVRLAI